jgi:hypothetical protein
MSGIVRIATAAGLAAILTAPKFALGKCKLLIPAYSAYPHDGNPGSKLRTGGEFRPRLPVVTSTEVL